MKFSLAKQNVDATTPLPKSSATCPTGPTLSKEDKGLIAVGVILGVLLFGLLAYGIYRYLTAQPQRNGVTTPEVLDATDETPEVPQTQQPAIMS
jgi:hypothetical protein